MKRTLTVSTQARSARSPRSARFAYADPDPDLPAKKKLFTAREVKKKTSELLREAGEDVVALDESKYVTPAMTKDWDVDGTSDPPKYFAILFYDTDATMKWGVAKRMFENRKGEMVVLCMSKVQGMEDTYCCTGTDVSKRTAIEKSVPRVPLEYTSGGLSNTIVLTAPMMDQVRMFNAVEKTKSLFQTARKHITAYDGEDEGFHPHKHLQNDMIQLAVQTCLGGGRFTCSRPPTTTAIVLDSIGFQSSKAVLAGAGMDAIRVSPRWAKPILNVTVPNYSDEFEAMKGTEPAGVTLIPISLADAVKEVKQKGSLSVLVADTCGTFNEELQSVISSAFSRELFSEKAVLSITVNCRGMSTRAVLREMKQYLDQVSVMFGARYECSREYTYGQMAFLLGVVHGPDV